jgi:anti-anti-sigma regulatory factor
MATPITVEQVTAGDHACLTFSDAEERLDIVSAFVQDGLDARQKVLCLTDSLAPSALYAELERRGVAVKDVAAWRRGGPDEQLVVRDSGESWLLKGSFDADSMVKLIGTEVDAAHDQGYSGLRLTADMCWATRPASGLEQLLVFESALSTLFLDGRLTAICQYDRSSFDAVTLAVAAKAHPRAVAAATYYEDPLLRICRQHRPPGIRVAGELDFTCMDALTHALSETLRLDRNPTINLSALSFLDVASASVLMRAAQGLGEGREMRLVCGWAPARVLSTVGAERVPRLSLVITDGS